MDGFISWSPKYYHLEFACMDYPRATAVSSGLIIISIKKAGLALISRIFLPILALANSSKLFV